MCPFCGGPMNNTTRGQYRAIPGEKKQPEDWVSCHITCARERQQQGWPITVRWFPPQRA